MSASERLAAVVLAGGRGTRMGGVDKGLVDYRGRPLVAWVLDAIRPQVDEIFISANRNADLYARYGHPVLADPLPGFPGPLAGVLAALQAGCAPWLLVVPCDTPHLPADLAACLADAARRAGRRIAVAADDERIHPTVMLVHRDCRAALDAYLRDGGHAVHRWLESQGYARARFARAALANLNRPEDLTRVSQSMT
jgi:molybdopterin-guanine dinucleotide biosynthesis protein A